MPRHPQPPRRGSGPRAEPDGEPCTPAPGEACGGSAEARHTDGAVPSLQSVVAACARFRPRPGTAPFGGPSEASRRLAQAYGPQAAAPRRRWTRRGPRRGPRPCTSCVIKATHLPAVSAPHAAAPRLPRPCGVVRAGHGRGRAAAPPRRFQRARRPPHRRLYTRDGALRRGRVEGAARPRGAARQRPVTATPGPAWRRRGREAKPGRTGEAFLERLENTPAAGRRSRATAARGGAQGLACRCTAQALSRQVHEARPGPTRPASFEWVGA